MRLILSSLAALLVLSACVVQKEYPTNDVRDRNIFDGNSPFNDEEFDEDEWQDNYVEQQLNINTGRVQGDIGNTTGFDAPAESINSYSDGYWSNVSVTAYDGSSRMGMIILDVSGIDLRTAPVGRYTASSVSGTVDGPGTDGDETIYCTACATDYDAPANDCEVTISETEQGRQVVVDVSIPDANYSGETEARGSFVIVE